MIEVSALFVAATVSFAWCAIRSKRNEAAKAIALAESYRKYADGWEEAARHYRKKWHEAEPDSESVKRDKRAVVLVRDGKPQWMYTATLPAWVFGQTVASMNELKERKSGD